VGSDPVMKITLNKNTFLLKLPEMSEILSDGRDYDVTFAVHREKRSLSANGYLWALCERLAKKLGIGKEEVYRRQIKEVGVCEFVAVPERAYDRLIESWGAQGIGWFAELVDNCKLQGCKKVCLYYGSSTYNTAEMSRLIESVIQECREQGIETEPRERIEELLRDWGR